MIVLYMWNIRYEEGELINSWVLIKLINCNYLVISCIVHVSKKQIKFMKERQPIW